MRNFIIVVNILALTLPFLVAEVQNQEQLACRENNEILYDQQRLLKTPVRYELSSSLRYEPNYYPYRPSVAFVPYMYYPFVMKKLLLIKSPAQISQWQPTPNFQHTGVPHGIPSPSFLAIPTNENVDNTAIPAIPNINTIAPVEPSPVPVTEPMTTAVANPEASTVPINIPETTEVPALSPQA